MNFRRPNLALKGQNQKSANRLICLMTYIYLNLIELSERPNRFFSLTGYILRGRGVTYPSVRRVVVLYLLYKEKNRIFRLERRRLMLTREDISNLLKQGPITQLSICYVAGVRPSQMSLWLRERIDLPEGIRDSISLAVQAMSELSEESSIPPDWKRIELFKPLVDERIAGLRRTRSEQLRQRFKESLSPSPCATA